MNKRKPKQFVPDHRSELLLSIAVRAHGIGAEGGVVELVQRVWLAQGVLVLITRRKEEAKTGRCRYNLHYDCFDGRWEPVNKHRRICTEDPESGFASVNIEALDLSLDLPDLGPRHRLLRVYNGAREVLRPQNGWDHAFRSGYMVLYDLGPP